MKRLISLVSVIILVVLGVAMSESRNTLSAQQRRWEYKVQYLPAPPQEHRMNELGAEGWELSSVSEGYFIFKREK